MLGYLSSNSKTQDLSRTDHVDYILGTTSSKQMLTIGHNRVLKGSTAAICTFSETQSVAVVMVNGLQTAAVSDCSASIMIQAPLSLQPLEFYILESLRTINIHYV
ncbi:hypothetical protein BDV33DRAFT_168657 [Aspergillus novoparasiticus]|uniref:Uncharacterized protein n=1 Tax=Aspergillus novoparasiticus TaxID=986946 RepID=A0A5N6F0U6_9EURO|nr:hypothetical protein BDV33DRAFT_168657 [Aspergillus novoparasiticus]